MPILKSTSRCQNTTPNIGDVITYTVTVTNSGKDNAENVELTDTLPTLTGLSIIGTPVTSAGTFDHSHQWHLGHRDSLCWFSCNPIGASRSARAPVTGNPLPQTNTATITSSHSIRS